MPETKQTNGHSNGHTYEMENESSFLFTSESVGEGHPGKDCGITFRLIRIFNGEVNSRKPPIV